LTVVDDLTSRNGERDTTSVEVGENDPRETGQGFGEGESYLRTGREEENA